MITTDNMKFFRSIIVIFSILLCLACSQRETDSGSTNTSDNANLDNSDKQALVQNKSNTGQQNDDGQPDSESEEKPLFTMIDVTDSDEIEQVIQIQETYDSLAIKMNACIAEEVPVEKCKCRYADSIAPFEKQIKQMLEKNKHWYRYDVYLRIPDYKQSGNTITLSPAQIHGRVALRGCE